MVWTNRCGRKPLNDSTNSPVKFRNADKVGKSPAGPTRQSFRLAATAVSATAKQMPDGSITRRLRSASVKSPPVTTATASDGTVQPTRRKPGRPFGTFKRPVVYDEETKSTSDKRKIDHETAKMARTRSTRLRGSRADGPSGGKPARRTPSIRQAKELAACRMYQRNFKLSVDSLMVDRWRNSEVFIHDKGLPYVQLSAGDMLTKRKDDSPDSAYSSGVASRSSRGTDDGTPPLATARTSINDGQSTAPTSKRQPTVRASRIVKRGPTTAGGRAPSAKRAKKEGAKRGVSYQGIRRMEYKDLFCDILPFVKPTYTPLANPPMPHLIGVDTSKRWLCHHSEAKLNEFVDVGVNEKEFFALWNAFTMRRENRPVGCAGLPLMLERFVKEFGATLARRNLLFNFISHCACLCRSGFLSQSQMFNAMALLETLKFEPFVASRPAKTRRSPQRSPTKNKVIKSLSNLFRLS